MQIGLSPNEGLCKLFGHNTRRVKLGHCRVRWHYPKQFFLWSKLFGIKKMKLFYRGIHRFIQFRNEWFTHPYFSKFKTNQGILENNETFETHPTFVRINPTGRKLVQTGRGVRRDWCTPYTRIFLLPTRKWTTHICKDNVWWQHLRLSFRRKPPHTCFWSVEAYAVLIRSEIQPHTHNLSL